MSQPFKQTTALSIARYSFAISATGSGEFGNVILRDEGSIGVGPFLDLIFHLDDPRLR
jgi:hypothetical protein